MIRPNRKHGKSFRSSVKRMMIPVKNTAISFRNVVEGMEPDMCSDAKRKALCMGKMQAFP